MADGQKCADRNRRHDQWDGNVFKDLPRIRAIDLGCFDQFCRDTLDPRDINDHHITNHLPIHQNDQSPKTVFGSESDINPELDQNPVDDQLPDIAKDDAADEVWHKKHGAENIGAF